MNQNEGEEHDIPFNFFPVFLALFRRKKLITINILIVFFVSFFYAFFIAKKDYLSKVSFFPPTSEAFDLPTEFSGRILNIDRSYGIMNEQIFSVFESGTIKRSIINRFGLYEKYKLTKNPNRFLLASKRLQKDLYLDIYESGFMSFSKLLGFSISGFSTSPDTAFLITQSAFELLDSCLQAISTDRARRNRQFIEQQLENNKNKLDSLQLVMKRFQDKNKAVNIPEQVYYSIQTYSTIKALAEFNELSLKNLKAVYTKEVPEIKELEKTLKIYRKKLYEMERDTQPNILAGFARYSKIFPEYTNLTREIEVAQYLAGFLMKEAEQAKLSEAKTVSSLIVIDPPTIPEYKSRPKRVMLMGKISFLYLLVFFACLYVYEVYSARKSREKSFGQ